MQFEKTPLTGLDHFFLALEKHNRKSKAAGNTCKYFLELDGALEKEELASKLSNHTLSNQLSAIRLKKKSIIKGSYWVAEEESQIEIRELETEEKFHQEVLEFNIELEMKKPYLCFYLLKRTDNSTTLVLCWHHLLMDGYGAALYLASLNGHEGVKLLGNTVKKYSFSEARQARFFVRKTSEPTLTSVYSGKQTTEPAPGILKIEFSEEESEIIAQNAIQSGAVFGQSTFYLATCGIAVKQIIEEEGKTVNDFWIPVPQDQRKKNAKGPVLSNHLSMLFFRLRKTNMQKGREILTGDLTNQMKNQMRDRIPEKYNSLMHYLRVLPKSTYYKLIKGPHGGALSSFLFTVAPEHPKQLDTFFGRQVTDAMNTPPVTYPPGLTFAFAKYKTKTRIFVVYSTDVFPPTKLKNLEKTLKELLLQRDI